MKRTLFLACGAVAAVAMMVSCSDSDSNDNTGTNKSSVPAVGTSSVPGTTTSSTPGEVTNSSAPAQPTATPKKVLAPSSNDVSIADARKLGYEKYNTATARCDLYGATVLTSGCEVPVTSTATSCVDAKGKGEITELTETVSCKTADNQNLINSEGGDGPIVPSMRGVWARSLARVLDANDGGNGNNEIKVGDYSVTEANEIAAVRELKVAGTVAGIESTLDLSIFDVYGVSGREDNANNEAKTYKQGLADSDLPIHVGSSCPFFELDKDFNKYYKTAVGGAGTLLVDNATTPTTVEFPLAVQTTKNLVVGFLYTPGQTTPLKACVIPSGLTFGTDTTRVATGLATGNTTKKAAIRLQEMETYSLESMDVAFDAEGTFYPNGYTLSGASAVCGTTATAANYFDKQAYWLSPERMHFSKEKTGGIVAGSNTREGLLIKCHQNQGGAGIQFYPYSGDAKVIIENANHSRRDNAIRTRKVVDNTAAEPDVSLLPRFTITKTTGTADDYRVFAAGSETQRNFKAYNANTDFLAGRYDAVADADNQFAIVAVKTAAGWTLQESAKNTAALNVTDQYLRKNPTTVPAGETGLACGNDNEESILFVETQIYSGSKARAYRCLPNGVDDTGNVPADATDWGSVAATDRHKPTLGRFGHFADIGVDPAATIGTAYGTATAFNAASVTNYFDANNIYTTTSDTKDLQYYAPVDMSKYKGWAPVMRTGLHRQNTVRGAKEGGTTIHPVDRLSDSDLLFAKVDKTEAYLFYPDHGSASFVATTTAVPNSTATTVAADPFLLAGGIPTGIATGKAAADLVGTGYQTATNYALRAKTRANSRLERGNVFEKVGNDSGLVTSLTGVACSASNPLVIERWQNKSRYDVAHSTEAFLQTRREDGSINRHGNYVPGIYSPATCANGDTTRKWNLITSPITAKDTLPGDVNTTMAFVQAESTQALLVGTQNATSTHYSIWSWGVTEGTIAYLTNGREPAALNERAGGNANFAIQCKDGKDGNRLFAIRFNEDNDGILRASANDTSYGAMYLRCTGSANTIDQTEAVTPTATNGHAAATDAETSTNVVGVRRWVDFYQPLELDADKTAAGGLPTGVWSENNRNKNFYFLPRVNYLTCQQNINDQNAGRFAGFGGRIIFLQTFGFQGDAIPYQCKTNGSFSYYRRKNDAFPPMLADGKAFSGYTFYMGNGSSVDEIPTGSNYQFKGEGLSIANYFVRKGSVIKFAGDVCQTKNSLQIGAGEANVTYQCGTRDEDGAASVRRAVLNTSITTRQ